MWNAKVRCIESNNYYVMKEGNIYEFCNGRFKHEDGICQSCKYESKEDFEARNPEFKIELVTDLPQPHRDLLQSGDKLVRRDGSKRYILLETNGLYYESGDLADKAFDDNDKVIVGRYNDSLISPLKSQSIRFTDVMYVYRGGVLVMERTKKSPQDIEVERIESEMRKLSEAQNKLADDLKKIKQL